MSSTTTIITASQCICPFQNVPVGIPPDPANTQPNPQNLIKISLNPTTPGFNVVQSGTYNINADITFATNSTSGLSLTITKNGTTLPSSSSVTSATGGIRVATEATNVFLTPSDFIQIVARQSTSSGVLINPARHGILQVTRTS